MPLQIWDPNLLSLSISIRCTLIIGVSSLEIHNTYKNKTKQKKIYLRDQVSWIKLRRSTGGLSTRLKTVNNSDGKHGTPGIKSASSASHGESACRRRNVARSRPHESLGSLLTSFFFAGYKLRRRNVNINETNEPSAMSVMTVDYSRRAGSARTVSPTAGFHAGAVMTRSYTVLRAVLSREAVVNIYTVFSARLARLSLLRRAV